jgi:polyvinyl alcohol dehydrogenase (cytochrome)
MTGTGRLRTLALLSAFAFLAAAAHAQTPQVSGGAPASGGEAIYKARCASCHDNPGTTRAQTLEVLRGTAAEDIRTSLTGDGVMAPMAAGLSSIELNQLVAWLTANQRNDTGWFTSIACPAERLRVDVSAPVTKAGFGVDARSTRNMTARQAGLNKADLRNLEVAWAIGVPRTQGMGMGVSVMGDTAFVSARGRLLALEAASGCVRWSYEISSPNTPTIGDVEGRRVLALASNSGEVHMLDAGTGALIWKANGKPSNNIGQVRGGVVIHQDKVIVPISASGVGAGMNPRFECCEGKGAVVALAATDGRRLWEYHTMPDPTYNGQVNSVGVKQRGPSGAPIWSVPTIDAARNRVIVTTGENTSHPGTNTSDAVIAIDLDTGKEAWVFQGMAADIWNMACDARTPHPTTGGLTGEGRTNGPNCPYLFGGEGRDFDFGASAILAKGPGGKDIVLAGQKSGDVWALDAQTGQKLWNQRVGEGSALGGVHWGIATDGTRVFAPINDPLRLLPPPHIARPGLHAFNLKTGKPLWSHAAQARCEGERGQRIATCTQMYGYSAAPLVIDGAVIASNLLGEVFVFDGKSGKLLNTTDTFGPIQTINGLEAKGGAIDSHGISAGAGVLFVASGYGAFNQAPGNVLIALRPKR